ncbi:MAG: GNAT family N-acetyltransferase [Actinomycetota bacterium]|nr:GNAT family N-acetyltransferase [Actinomycetota bacterium]
MAIAFTRLDPTGEDHDALVEFMTRNEFPFHGRPRPTVADVETAISEGAYRDEDNDSFWIDHSELERIGFFRLEDLSDDAPLFDLRLDTARRGRGLGVQILRSATNHVFSTMPDVNRFEGQTREDNIAMRRTFLRCGWLKEAHYREGWPVDGGVPVASVAYSIIRRDWQTGQTTTFIWEDLTD